MAFGSLRRAFWAVWMIMGSQNVFNVFLWITNVSFNMFYVVLPQIHRWTLISLKDNKYFIKSIITTVFFGKIWASFRWKLPHFALKTLYQEWFRSSNFLTVDQSFVTSVSYFRLNLLFFPLISFSKDF